MKRLLIATCALLVVVPDVAVAYQTTREAPTTRPARKPARPATKPAPARPSAQRPTTRPARPTTKPARPSRPTTKPARPINQRPTRPVTKPAPVRPNRPSIQPVRPNRPYVRPPTYRPGYRPSTYRRIHRPVFVYPRGYSYRRWHSGLYLPHLFLSSRYFFYDYYALGLGAPPHGYVWVRYGPDLLLIQRRNGRIVDVIYGAFY